MSSYKGECGFVPSLLELDCSVINNIWGKTGPDSLVATFKAAQDKHFQPEKDTHYAQLWLGDHPNGKTVIKHPNKHLHLPTETTTLREWLQIHTKQLGSIQDPELPFLLKVLSIQAPLALQVHPGKTLAEKLHNEEPDVFDPNHKPEMAIALSRFVALVGFRRIQEVAAFLAVNEFREALGAELSLQLLRASELADKNAHSAQEASKKVLQGVFSCITDTNNIVAGAALQKLVARLKKDSDHVDAIEYEAILQMDRYFSGDVGALAVFLLNVVVLEPGEAFFVDAMIPHAYITGDCVEIQASSDNVLRAAFTHKRRDVDLMISGMTFTQTLEEEFRVKPDVVRREELTSFHYPSLYTDFAVTKYHVQAKDVNSSTTLPALPGPSICLVVQGQGRLSCQTNYCANPSQIRSNGTRRVNAGNGLKHCEDVADHGSLYDINFQAGTAVFIAANTSVIVSVCGQINGIGEINADINENNNVIIFRGHSGMQVSEDLSLIE